MLNKYIFVDMLFITILLLAVCVILTKSPIRSVLYLIAIFLSTSVLFLLFGSEFIAILLITVYIGAIAVLFLFVVMMFNLRTVGKYSSIYLRLLVGVNLIIAFFLIYFYTLYIEFNYTNFSQSGSVYVDVSKDLYRSSNMQMIGQVFYNYYVIYLYMVGFILFIAMIGVIVLTTEVLKTSKVETNLKRIVVSRILWRNMQLFHAENINTKKV